MTSKKFGTIRAFLWPVHREEYRKFIPMLLLSFFICFNYYILRAFKDSLIVTAPESGAEVIPFLKVWAILPMALIMTFIFTRFSNYLSRQNVFYAMLGFYILYFIAFTFFLYPNRDTLHPHALADRLQAFLPEGCRGLVAIFRYWTYTTFYIMAEMWSTMIVTVLFWGFANDVTPLKDAKRFYGLFGVATNVSGIFAGWFCATLSKNAFNPSLPFGKDGWDQSVMLLNLLIIVTGILSLAIYRWLNRNGLGYTAETIAAHKEEPIKMGIRKNFSYLAKSKYLMLIALLVLAINIAINLCEVVWKDQVRNLYPTPADYNAYMGGVVSWIGTIATVVSLLISGNLIRLFSWTTSAMIAPLLTLVTGIFFFACLLLPESFMIHVGTLLGLTPLALAVFLGSLQNSVVRGTKYSLVDATKELAFIPLSQESKLKGKAAIDGVGSRIGKSGGSLIQQGLIIGFGSLAASTPIISAILLFALGGWILAVRALGKQFQSLTTEHQTVSIPEEEKSPTLEPST
jgi:AAA family ATP:ADP antiporter